MFKIYFEEETDTKYFPTLYVIIEGTVRIPIFL